MVNSGYLNFLNMKKSHYSESKIIAILSQQETGSKVFDIYHKHGISQATFFNWKAKYGGMSSNHLKKLKELESENARLKKMYADISLVHNALKDAVINKL
jgi:putative transposase